MATPAIRLTKGEEKKKETTEKQNHSTQDSHVVPHHGTN